MSIVKTFKISKEVYLEIKVNGIIGLITLGKQSNNYFVTLKEIWRKVPGFLDYQVSSFGNVISYRKGYLAKVKPWHTTHKYLQVNFQKNGKRKMFKVHRLVALAFYGPSKLHIDHRDERKTFNVLFNIRYCTVRQNVIFCRENQRKIINRTSKYLGVYWSKQAKKWHSLLCLGGGKRLHVGYLTSEKAASTAYRAAIKKYVRV